MRQLVSIYGPNCIRVLTKINNLSIIAAVEKMDRDSVLAFDYRDAGFRLSRRYVRYRPDSPDGACLNDRRTSIKELLMYFGGGILGTILVIALIVWIVRRA
jgi:hypothetical protein